MFKVGLPARLDEPMSEHSSFRIGGPADLYVLPADAAEAAEVLRVCVREGVPVLLLGGGTNILVSDRGVRGTVVDLSRLAGIRVQDSLVTALAGTPVSDVSEEACTRGLSGLEFAYSLPGSVGGAVWMNARCYGGEISDVLEHVDYLQGDDLQGDDLPGDNLQPRRYEKNAADWGYKKSPFQVNRKVVLSASFRLRPGNPTEMRRKMRSYREDRERKGHFLHPCAGSIFKNNRAFGAPTGQLVDSLGLKGTRIGDAQIAPYHGNIFINTGNARASDMRTLIEKVEQEARARLGFELEREVILVGEWD